MWHGESIKFSNTKNTSKLSSTESRLLLKFKHSHSLQYQQIAYNDNSSVPTVVACINIFYPFIIHRHHNYPTRYLVQWNG